MHVQHGRLRAFVLMLCFRLTASFRSLSTPAVLGRRRLLCAEGYVPSILPKDIHIPLDKVEFAFARSSGAGGQNVNKLNTKAEIRFHVDSADWLQTEVKARLHEYHGNKISKDGDIIVVCQEHRTQPQNKAVCVQRLQEMIAEASVEPKERQQWQGIGDKGKAIRRVEKTKRASVKRARSGNFRDDY